MATTSPAPQNLDHFFSSSAARLDRWRELNAKAQTWAAEARSGKRGGGRAATEAALAEVRALEDFFAFPGHAADEDTGRAHQQRRRTRGRATGATHQRRAAVGQLSLRLQRMGEQRRG